MGQVIPDFTCPACGGQMIDGVILHAPDCPLKNDEFNEPIDDEGHDYELYG